MLERMDKEEAEDFERNLTLPVPGQSERSIDKFEAEQFKKA